MLAGYYWEIIDADASSYVQSCHACQVHSRKVHLPQTNQRPIYTAWPFSTRGIEIAGPLPEASGQRKFIIVAIDHFTKWVEAMAVNSITPEKVIDFV